jgi:NDP-sugar pyrophosphorylase family protein
VISTAVVIAAGEGRRLRPVTERWAKPVLPIDGRPVIVTLLRALAEAGVERIWVVVGHLGDQVRALVAGLGLDVRFVEQPRADGSADAVQRALDAGAEPPLLVTAADTVFGHGDLAAFAATAASYDGGIAGRRQPPPSPPHRYPLEVRDGLVRRVLGEDGAGGLAAAPLWLLGESVTARLCEDEAPYELASAFQAAIDDGAAIAGVEIGPTRDLTDPVDLMHENVAYLRGLGV